MEVVRMARRILQMYLENGEVYYEYNYNKQFYGTHIYDIVKSKKSETMVDVILFDYNNHNYKEVERIPISTIKKKLYRGLRNSIELDEDYWYMFNSHESWRVLEMIFRSFNTYPIRKNRGLKNIIIKFEFNEGSISIFTDRLSFIIDNELNIMLLNETKNSEGEIEYEADMRDAENIKDDILKHKSYSLNTIMDIVSDKFSSFGDNLLSDIRLLTRCMIQKELATYIIENLNIDFPDIWSNNVKKYEIRYREPDMYLDYRRYKYDKYAKINGMPLCIMNKWRHEWTNGKVNDILQAVNRYSDNDYVFRFGHFVEPY